MKWSFIFGNLEGIKLTQMAQKIEKYEMKINYRSLMF